MNNDKKWEQIDSYYEENNDYVEVHSDAHWQLFDWEFSDWKIYVNNVEITDDRKYDYETTFKQLSAFNDAETDEWGF